MPDIMTVNELRPLVGSPNFVPALLAYVRKSSSGNLPLDPVILQSILLCMIAGQKHLILNTPEEDVGLVVKLVVWTLSSVFDLPIHKVKVKSRTSSITKSTDIAPPRDPNKFLRSLFLPLSRNDPLDQSRPPSRAKTRTGKRRTAYLRSVSFPNDLSNFGTSNVAENADMPMKPDIREVDEADQPPLVIKTPQPRPFFHAHTEPAPSRREVTGPEFPRTLVISGLENATYAEQAALTRVLTERQVVLEVADREVSSTCSGQRGTSAHTQDSDANPSGYNLSSEDFNYEGTWNVPDDFFVIYVCPWNPKERPNIDKSLLDHFAMSSTVLVQQHIRQALHTFPFTSNSTSHGRHHSHSHSYSNPPTPSPLQSPPLPQARTPPIFTRSLPSAVQQHSTHRSSYSLPSLIVPKQLLPREFILHLQSTAQNAHVSYNLSLYLSDIFSAVRHHPKLDGTFLTVRSMNDADALARACRVLGTDPTGGELIRGFPGIYPIDSHEDDDDSGSFHLHDFTSVSATVTIDITRKERHLSSLVALVDEDQRSDAPESVSDGPSEPLYVSEADIARIVPRVVTHRLRVRDGPEDEVLAGAMFGATFKLQGNYLTGLETISQEWDARRTIKDILVDILAEV